jgi:hypothetical protein
VEWLRGTNHGPQEVTRDTGRGATGRWVASGVVVAVPGDPVTYRLGRRFADLARWPLDRSRVALRAHFIASARDRRGAVLRPGVDVEALRLLQTDADRHREWRVVLAFGAVLDAAYAVSARELPLATFNIKDYAGFAEHGGLQLVNWTPDVECLVERITAHGRAPGTQDANRKSR